MKSIVEEFIDKTCVVLPRACGLDDNGEPHKAVYADELKQFHAKHPVLEEEMVESLPRIVELVDRMTAVGSKCAQVSASETHEIADFIYELESLLQAAEPANPDSEVDNNER